MCPNSYIYNMKKPKPKVKRAIPDSKIVQSAEDLKRQGRVLEARAFLEDHIDDLKKNGLEREYVNGLSVLSDLRRGTDDSKSAKMLLQQSLTLAKKHGFEDLAGEITKKRAFLCLLLEEYKQCHEDALSALKMSREQSNRQLEIGALAVLGHLHEVRKERPKALVWFRQAMSIATEIDDTWRRAGLYHDLGRIHGELREYLTGLDYLEQGEQYCLKHKYMNRYYMMIRAQGDIYKAIGDLNKAKALYEKSHSDPETQDNPSEALENSTRYGDLYVQMGMIDKALETFQRGAKIARSLKYKRKILQNYFGIARCYELQFEFGKAFAMYQKVFKALAGDFENRLSMAIAALEMCAYTLSQLDNLELAEKLEEYWRKFQSLEDEGTYTAHRRAEMRGALLREMPDYLERIKNTKIGIYIARGIQVNPKTGEIRVRGETQPEPLKGYELKAFRLLFKNLGKMLSAREIFATYSDEGNLTDAAISKRIYTLINSIRTKGIPDTLLITVSKKGYKLLPA